MDFLTVKEVAEKWGVGTRIVTQYCETNRLPGALKKGNLWLIPSGVEKPLDRRTRKARKK